jgi:pyruvate formate lyase activating enzyme
MFMAGSMILSVGSYGCNLHCPFCQNWEISMPEEALTITDVTPAELCEAAKRLRPQGNIGIAYTYNEPLMGYDFVVETGELIHEENMKNVLVSNGNFGRKVADRVIPLMDAMNIDLKGFSDRCYHIVGGELHRTKEFIERAVELGTHTEVTTLIVPGLTDSEKMMDEEARWMASLDADMPLHVTRFFPNYRMSDVEATDVDLVYRLAQVARGHLNNVFTGNC